MNLKMDIDWDLAMEDNELVLIDGSEEIAQLVQQRVGTFLGEWFLDSSIGVPYFQQILKKNPDPAVIDAVLKKTISQTDGLLELTAMDIDIDAATRTLTVEFSALVEDDPNEITFTVRVG